MYMQRFAAICFATALQAAALAEELPNPQEPPMPPLRPDQVTFLALFKELVETNTTLSAGSCTLAAERMAAHLGAAGYADKDITLFSVPEYPKEGGLVAVLHGRSSAAKAILLLGHLDVVEAKREDWSRDPFSLIQENGYFFGRGTADMKGMDASWVDIMMRFKQGGFRPRRTIKLALTCGEETVVPFNGAQWLAQNRPELISAAFALSEGGGGLTDGHGKLLVQRIKVGEKAYQSFRVETFNEGGHSSIPIRDNAIYELADALAKVRDYEFPVKLTDTTRAYFAKSATAVGGEMGRAMLALSRNPSDRAAAAVLSKDRINNSLLRTTCVATLLEGGHAENALPQHAAANVNCRIFPGETLESTQAALEKAIADPRVKVSPVPPVYPVPPPPPLDPKVVGPAEKLSAKYFPGVPLIPVMSTAVGDEIFIEPIGIPVYGVPGEWGDPDGNGTHGLNERISVRSLFVGRDYLTDLVKAYADMD
jgi:acetylornithine deacetylase/succinyl-diaminopimelate desuccinylase-like protein